MNPGISRPTQSCNNPYKDSTGLSTSETLDLGQEMDTDVILAIKELDGVTSKCL